MDKPIKATKQQKKIVRLEKEFGPSVKAEGTSDFRESAWHKAPTPRFHFLFERKFCFRPKYTYIYQDRSTLNSLINKLPKIHE